MQVSHQYEFVPGLSLLTWNLSEKLRAVSSPWSECVKNSPSISLLSSWLCYLRWITKLETRHVNNDDGLAACIDFETKRGRNYHNLVSLVYCCHGLPEETSPSAQKIEKWLSRDDDGPTEAFRNKIENVLRTMWWIAQHREFNEGFHKIKASKVAPIEFIFIGLLNHITRGPLELTHQAFQEFSSSRYPMRVMKPKAGRYIFSDMLSAKASRISGPMILLSELCGDSSAICGNVLRPGYRRISQTLPEVRARGSETWQMTTMMGTTTTTSSQSRPQRRQKVDLEKPSRGFVAYISCYNSILRPLLL